MNPAYLYVLISVTSFSLASLFFAELSRKTTPLWMNAFKATVALVCFLVASMVAGGFVPIATKPFLALFFSGVLGLAIGDVFLFTAFARMGSARTLVIYGFQPLFIGVSARILFHQEMTAPKSLAVLFFIGCLFLFSLEKFRATGKWEVLGLLAALFGVMLDNVGVLLTRWAFDHTPGMGGFQANLIRCAGACLFFLVGAPVNRVHLARGFAKLNFKFKTLALFSSFLGTFVALYFYLNAIRLGHLASIAAIVASAPIISAALESAYQRKWPSRYLLAALVLFVLGFLVLSRF